MKPLYGLLSCVLGIGCSAGIPSDAKTTVVSLAQLDNGECGGELAKGLSTEDGVYKTAFNLKDAEITVVSAPKVDVLAAATRHKNNDEGYEIVAGKGHGSYVPFEKAADGTDVQIISENGADIPDLATHLAQGKVTIVDFSAKWCGPCHILDGYIMKSIKGRGDLAYRKADIGDWDSPLATHYMKNVSMLPFVIIFDKSGKEVGRVAGVDEEKLDGVIAKAASGS